MAEVTYRSPGVFTREIDLSQPTVGQPVGIPAGVIGTSNRGPAFVPITVASYTGFASVFGQTDGEKFGPIAVNEFLKNAQALTYLRVLGIGDGDERSASTGKVTNAGFVVGDRIVQENGVVGNNPKASTTRNEKGRTFFLGAFMSASQGSTYFSDAGIQNSSTGSVILRGIIMAPSGVIVTVSGNMNAGGSAKPGDTTVYNQADGIANIQGSLTGAMNMANQQFTLLLNGHKNTGENPNVYTCSFDLQANSYFSNVLNTDPTKIEDKGHLLYGHYDIDSSLAQITGSGLLDSNTDFSKGASGTWENCVFITTGSAARDTSETTQPNYESFEERFTFPQTPFINSQTFGSDPYPLFRVQSLDDGDYANTLIKISIENIQPSKTDTYKYGTFDLVVREFGDSDYEVRKLESWRGLNLDPTSDKYVARAIGDQRAFFDFDQASSSQKLVVEGNHPLRSSYIRVKLSSQLSNGEVPQEALPFGFRGHSHLVTSGSGPLTDLQRLASSGRPAKRTAGIAADQTEILKRAVEPPIPYRRNVKVGKAPNEKSLSSLYWGVRTGQQTTLGHLQNDLGILDASMKTYAKFFPSFDPSTFNFSVGNNPGAADSSGTVLDCNTFNNNQFSLEKIQVRTGSDGVADVLQWASASYLRRGGITANEANKTRALKVSDLKTQGNRTYSKFTVLLQGGFNGTNVFDEDKSKLLNAAARREMSDSTVQGGVDGPTVAAYRKALDIMGTKSDVDIQLLVIPGLRHSSVTDYALDTVESRFDAMYIMDIEERDQINEVITSSLGKPNVTYTAASFKDRALDSSFGASYFPDVIVQDPTTHTNVRVPPSTVVLGAFSQNDVKGWPWFAPAGFSRGTLNNSLFSAVPLNKANMDDLYDVDINPITSFPSTGLMVFGQKTLQANPSSLDRVNVRRLLIYIRRKVRDVANLMLFEPNRQETLDKFNSLVQPIMQQVQERSGVDRFKVIIDATTTTQTDVENNTLRGKIFLQPTRTAEFVALDFVVTNAGDAFQNA